MSDAQPINLGGHLRLRQRMQGGRAKAERNARRAAQQEQRVFERVRAEAWERLQMRMAEAYWDSPPEEDGTPREGTPCTRRAGA